MLELLIVIAILYVAFKFAWWLIKTTIFIGLFAVVASSLWLLLLY